MISMVMLLRRRHKKRPAGDRKYIVYILTVLLIVTWVGLPVLFLPRDTNGLLSKDPADALKGTRIVASPKHSLQTASIDHIYETLLEIARLPAASLREVLDPSKSGNDPFHLGALFQGQCPWRGKGEEVVVVDWLPPHPFAKPAEIFRNRHQVKHDDNSRPVVVWYDHLSKAGGTSFCKLAQSNMPRMEVPAYYCMPSDGPQKPDGRVGNWTNDKLAQYIQQHPHRIVSNEWEPFPLERLELQAMSSADLTAKSDLPVLVFVTTIRHPLDRLLSAKRFWGELHNPSQVKPSLGRWLTNVNREAKKHPFGKAANFMANVGRFNFATWKFSGGTFPLSSELQAMDVLQEGGGKFETLEEPEWRPSFETAVRVLSRFDLVIPMEQLNAHTQAVREVLGWTDFNQTHVVPSGKVLNNDAQRQLPLEQYEALWEANKLDIPLYFWVTAVFLTRVHCADLLLPTE